MAAQQPIRLNDWERYWTPEQLEAAREGVTVDDPQTKKIDTLSRELAQVTKERDVLFNAACRVADYEWGSLVDLQEVLKPMRETKEENE